MANLFSKHRNKIRQQKKIAKQGASEKRPAEAVDAGCAPALQNAESYQVENLDTSVDASGLIRCQVLSLSHEGRGLAKNKGKTQFVHLALPGETVLASLHAHRAKYDELNTEKVLLASDQRVEPSCPHFGECGGCSLQHMAHEAQVEHKKSVLAEQLNHFGELQTKHWLETVQSKPFGYRARCRLAVDYQQRGTKLCLGFRKKNSKSILDIEQCPVLEASMSEALPGIKQLLGALTSGKAVSHIELSSHEEGLALLLRHVKPLNEGDIARLVAYAQEHTWTLYLQGGNVQSIRKVWPETGDDYLSYRLSSQYSSDIEDEDGVALKLAYHPKDFTQVNRSVNQEMVQLALKIMDIQVQDRVLDLFCGLGNFTLPMARKAQQVVGVEGSAEMVARGEMNAKLNEIDNVTFCESNLYDDVSAQSWVNAEYDKILIDPPRAGAMEMVPVIASFKAKRIVYISCNPATLARDAGALVQHGYTLNQAGILDMFPHTEHVESIAVFDRNMAD
jgi:23S rRNA (uracil1939-C5)-methyltransferase